MTTDQRAAERVSRLSPRVAVAIGSLVVAVVASWSGQLLVVAGKVIPGWAVGSALLVAALTLMRIRRGRRRPAAAAGSRRRRVLLRSLFALLVLAAVLGSVGRAASDLGANYHVLEPRGPGGCTAVVRETSFLFAGSGEVYAVGASGIAWTRSSWTADDGYEPVAAGSYELHWSSDSGTLTVNGTTTDPVWPSLHELRCG